MQRGRTLFLRAVVVFVLIVVSGRLAYFQTVKAGEILEQGDRVSRRNLMPLRGTIVDRNGNELARSVPKRTVEAYPRMISDKNMTETAQKLAPLLEMDAAELEALLRQNKDSWYLKLKSDLPISIGQAVEALSLEGIGVIEEAQRWYPWGSTANQIIGYVDSEGAGVYGLEARYDRELRGVPGYVRAEFTLRNTPIQNTIETMVPSAPGQTLVLTLDAALNRLFEERMAEVVQETDAKRALAIAMDVHTGGILAFAMTPGADLNDRRTWLGPDDEIDYSRIYNWGVRPIPPGSIFKAITIAAALEENKIHPNSVFDDPGIMIVDDWPIQNWNKVTHNQPNPLTVYELMQQSSNVGLIKIGQTMEYSTFVKYLEGFGLLEPTGLDVADEGWPNVGLPFEDKTAADYANIFIGQHIEYTPIQILTAWAALANGGYLVQPHFVQEIRDPDGQVIQQFAPVRKRQVISEQTSEQVRDILTSVLRDGTGRAALPEGYTAAGKTGTADKYHNGAIMDRQLADFVGFAPAENPQVAILIMVDEPAGEGWGGQIAAPEFAYLLPHVMRTIGIPPNSDAATGTETAPPAAENGIVPDVRYLPPVWARERLTAAGFTVTVTGSGQVVGAQSETPGALAVVGTEIELKLLSREQQVDGQVFVPDLIGYSLAEAHQIAAEVGFTLRAGGSGFVSYQEVPAGTTVPERGSVNVRLAPR